MALICCSEQVSEISQRLTGVLTVLFCFLPQLDSWVVNPGVVSWYLDYWWQRFSLYGLKIGDYCIPSSSFSIQDKAASISVPDFLRIGQRIFWQSLLGFIQWSKVSRQEWKGREPSGAGRRVAGLRTSQGDIVRPGFSISITWYLRILWSDIHKWPLPFRSCFTWWLVKNS